MSVSDTDWELLERRLQSIERSIEVLEKMFPVKEAPTPYALRCGSLTSPDTKQIWRNKDDE